MLTIETIVGTLTIADCRITTAILGHLSHVRAKPQTSAIIDNTRAATDMGESLPPSPSSTSQSQSKSSFSARFPQCRGRILYADCAP